jgi:hypothetical protein
MALAFEGATNSGELGTDDTLTMDSDTGTTSDVLLVAIETNGNLGADLTLSSISGGSLTWTQIGTTLDDTSTRHRYFYRSSQVTTTSAVTVSMVGSRAPTGGLGQWILGWIFRFSGVSSTPVAQSSSATNGQSTSVFGGSLTITSGNGSVLIATQRNNFGQTYTPPSTYTEDFDGGEAVACFHHFGVSGSQNPTATSTNNWHGTYGAHVELEAAGGAPAARVVDRVIRPAGARINSNFY